ncbi:hypothetical protein BRAO375_740040 [Bradyrhizobium sp. ORS 375]|nr:hypothetical protein BRAO375_740040 [Bradyrhizobium sp. ORS 375]
MTEGMDRSARKLVEPVRRGAVRLMDDFLRSQPGKPTNGPDPTEVRLFYVALTRAKEAVEVPQSVLSLMR